MDPSVDDITFADAVGVLSCVFTERAAVLAGHVVGRGALLPVAAIEGLMSMW